MKKIFLAAYLIFTVLGLAAQESVSGLIVYSVKGTVQLKNKKNLAQLTPYQELKPDAELFFGKDSRLYLIVKKDQLIYNFSETGFCKLSSLLSKINSSNSIFKNVSNLIIEKFIEKGKVKQGEKKIIGRGWVTRGGAENPFLFPADSSFIYLQHTFIPLVIEPDSGSTDLIKAVISRNGYVISKQKLLPGDSLTVKDNPELGFELALSWKNQTVNYNFLPLNAEQKMKIQSGIQEIESYYSNSPAEALLTKAIFFESNSCHLEAMKIYDQLISMYPDNELYLQERTKFLQMIK